VIIVRFVDIGGIDGHHCLNFLFIKEQMLGQVIIGAPLIKS
jgi:hypothetical protein